MRHFIVLFFLALIACPAQAGEGRLDPLFCQALVRHHPNADVAYRAGVDVKGRAVVPADLEGSSALTLPEELSLPLTVDIRTYLGIAAADVPFITKDCCEIEPVRLILRGDQVLFNGKALTKTQQDKIVELCHQKN